MFNIFLDFLIDKQKIVDKLFQEKTFPVVFSALFMFRLKWVDKYFLIDNLQNFWEAFLRHAINFIRSNIVFSIYLIKTFTRNADKTILFLPGIH